MPIKDKTVRINLKTTKTICQLQKKNLKFKNIGRLKV